MSSVSKINALELANGVPDNASWHCDYRDTSWVKIRGLNQVLSEGDILCVFSQFGEIDDLNLVRDKASGKILVCMLKFEQFRSAVLAVDNMNDVELVGSKLSIDHHRETVRKPKRSEPQVSFEERLAQVQPGQAYVEQASAPVSLAQGVDLFARSKEKRIKSWRQSDLDRKKQRRREE